MLQLYPPQLPATRNWSRPAFSLDDVEGMVRRRSMTPTPGFNVYIEAAHAARRLARHRARNVRRHRVRVRLVVDADHDKGKGGTVTVFARASRSRRRPETSTTGICSTGRFRPNRPSVIGDALRIATGADADTGVVTQPYRVAGTPNFPSKAKQARGRTLCGAHAPRRADRSPMGSGRASGAGNAQRRSTGERERDYRRERVGGAPTRRACRKSS